MNIAADITKVQNILYYYLRIVSYFNMFQITWCVILPDDGDVLSKACRRGRSCTVTYNVCAYIGFVNKTHILIARNEQCYDSVLLWLV